MARNTSESATDFRLWMTPTAVVMETVKRLAASVSTTNTSQARRPELVRKGRVMVNTTAERSSPRPSASTLTKSTVPFQLLFALIIFDSPRRRLGQFPVLPAESD